MVKEEFLYMFQEHLETSLHSCNADDYKKITFFFFLHFLPESPLYLPLMILTMSSMKSSLFEGLCRTSKI